MKLVAIAILSAHLLWIAAVIFGAFFTRGRPVWSALHIVSLAWGILVEVAPIPCPLTMAEQHFEARAGMQAYQGSFLMHYLDRIVYPDIPWWVVGTFGVAVCALNLAIYLWRFRKWQRARAAALIR
ncbi:MAG TPA: DUF2784 domain-containing protein [Silvibacterium sp.]|nr:DUF2784 domain-containing protein [Silvibacterium sp.]